MSYSYECNVICDGCKCAVSGGTQETADQATIEAINEAHRLLWHISDNRWFCPDCAKKVKVRE